SRSRPATTSRPRRRTRRPTPPERRAHPPIAARRIRGVCRGEAHAASGRIPLPPPRGTLVMFTRLTTAALAAATAAALAITPGAGASGTGASSSRPTCGTTHSRTVGVVGVTSEQRLICSRADPPSRARTIAAVTGLQTDTRLVGIDVRPANGVLYGLGEAGGIYTVNVDTAVATLVARTNVALRGMSFGVDFNPVADRLRVVSDVGQNLAVNVADGTTAAQTDVAYTPGTPATGVVG